MKGPGIDGPGSMAAAALPWHNDGSMGGIGDQSGDLPAFDPRLNSH